MNIQKIDKLSTLKKSNHKHKLNYNDTKFKIFKTTKKLLTKFYKLCIFISKISLRKIYKIGFTN